MSGITDLVTALEEVLAPRLMIAKASAGVYSDPTQVAPSPLVTLAEDCKNAYLPEILERALDGEFVVTLEEWDEFINAVPEPQPEQTPEGGEPF
jgi:hypothetical protein